MSEETRFYSKTRSHWDNDNDWSAEAGRGTDIINVRVPDQFTRYSVELLTPPGVSGYQVVSAPRKGSSGKQKFKIKWYYAPFGKVSYRLRAYHGKRKPVKIVVDSHNWLNEAKDAIEQGVEIQLVVRGNQARRLYRQILMLTENDLAVPSDLFFEPDPAMADGDEVPTSESDNGAHEVDHAAHSDEPAAEPATAITITVAICAALVIIAGFATLGGILMMAIQNKYTINTGKLEADTQLGDYSLIFDMTPSG